MNCATDFTSIRLAFYLRGMRAAYPGVDWGVRVGAIESRGSYRFRPYDVTDWMEWADAELENTLRQMRDFSADDELDFPVTKIPMPRNMNPKFEVMTDGE